MERYEKVCRQWNEILKNDKLTIPERKESGNEDFDSSLSWLTRNAYSVIDFGCASGSVLFLCSLCGTTKHIGIDLSEQGISNAKIRAKLMPDKEFTFICGGAGVLPTIASASMDAAILSNIIDNLYPDDAHSVLREMKRILKPDGRLLVKVNSYLTPEQIKQYDITPIEDNLLDDGMLLWNNSTEEWDKILGAYFHIDCYKNIYYKEYQQYNRLYQLIRQPSENL